MINLVNLRLNGDPAFSLDHIDRALFRLKIRRNPHWKLLRDSFISAIVHLAVAIKIASKFNYCSK